MITPPAARFFSWKLLWCLAVWCLFSARGLSAEAPTFDSANQLYSQGNFADAAKQYEQLAKSGECSANLYYNLGNTEYRLGFRGKAILDYERALLLEPAHAEARANLKLAREQAGSRLMPATWLDRILLPARAGVYAVLAAVSAWTVILICAFFWLRRRDESLGAWSALVLAVFVGAYSALGLWHDAEDRSLAIVTASEAVARLANAASAGPVENLPEGSHVSILSERDGWAYCDLPGRERGWIPSEAVQKVRDGDS